MTVVLLIFATIGFLSTLLLMLVVCWALVTEWLDSRQRGSQALWEDLERAWRLS